MNAKELEAARRSMSYWMERIKMAAMREWLRRAAELGTQQ